jgi:hypothetical protein
MNNSQLPPVWSLRYNDDDQIQDPWQQMANQYVPVIQPESHIAAARDQAHVADFYAIETAIHATEATRHYAEAYRFAIEDTATADTIANAFAVYANAVDAEAIADSVRLYADAAQGHVNAAAFTRDINTSLFYVNAAVAAVIAAEEYFQVMLTFQRHMVAETQNARQNAADAANAYAIADAAALAVTVASAAFVAGVDA